MENNNFEPNETETQQETIQSEHSQDFLKWFSELSEEEKMDFQVAFGKID